MPLSTGLRSRALGAFARYELQGSGAEVLGGRRDVKLVELLLALPPFDASQKPPGPSRPR